MVHLIIELLKTATPNVRFLEDDGPKAGREKSAFLREIEKADYILVIGSYSYGEKARSPLHSGVKSESRVIVERYNPHPKHIIQLLIEGTVATSFPSEMAHSQVGYLEATSADKLFSSIARVLERVYYYNNNPQLKEELEKLRRDFSSPIPNPMVLTEIKSNLEPLLKSYRKQGYLTRFLDPKKPFPIEESYINISLVNQEVAKKDPLASRETPLKVKVVKVSELFDGNTHLYIEGAAGSGKTTLCRYLVSSWLM